VAGERAAGRRALHLIPLSAQSQLRDARIPSRLLAHAVVTLPPAADSPAAPRQRTRPSEHPLPTTHPPRAGPARQPRAQGRRRARWPAPPPPRTLSSATVPVAFPKRLPFAVPDTPHAMPHWHTLNSAISCALLQGSHRVPVEERGDRRLRVPAPEPPVAGHEGARLGAAAGAPAAARRCRRRPQGHRPRPPARGRPRVRRAGGTPSFAPRAFCSGVSLFSRGRKVWYGY